VEKKILVIDDNKDIRENIAEILELANYTTFTAENGKRGVETALKEKPSLIICDIMMPELDGYGVLHLLRKNNDTQHIPFIFLTAKTERGDYRKGMEMGADDYITKPFEEIELLNAVETRLKKSEILTANYSSSSNELSRFLKDVKDEGIVNQLAEQYDISEYDRKSSLYTEGKRPKFMYCLVTGKVKTYRHHENGKEYITNFYSDGDFIGHEPILKDTNYDDNAAVIADSRIMQMPKEDFLQMVYTDVNIAAKFVHIMTRNVKEKEERLMNLAYSSLRKRVAKALIDIADKFGIHANAAPLGISREEIAQYIGTATESLIRTLSDFRAEKMIDIQTGKIIIKDEQRLKNLLF
jgi:CheY-like chemotaxis protein/CRP-like cAMP-binding protein